MDLYPEVGGTSQILWALGLVGPDTSDGGRIFWAAGHTKATGPMCFPDAGRLEHRLVDAEIDEGILGEFKVMLVIEVDVAWILGYCFFAGDAVTCSLSMVWFRSVDFCACFLIFVLSGLDD
ncbi:hypothetical protein DSO57_1028287 [Entomophthora muscae]|uniref:Uncharacterized protein n=1 Tax=Entomophthora muscae TaxID=34485 RepID=A0ACC2TNC7_9FUNG|nr:hypothetical protein DSO57_1028287 [Entomophthora muscae]